MTTTTCTLCQRPPRAGLLCWQHRDRLADLLDPRQHGTAHNPKRPDDYAVLPSIPVLYGHLDAAPATSGEQTGGGHAFGSRPPANLHVIALRDPRSAITGPGRDDDGLGAPWSTLTVLAELAARVDRRDFNGHPEARPARPHTVASLAGWLHARVDWLAEQSWVDEVWHDLRAVHSQLRAAGGDPAPRPVGTCRVVVDDDGHEDPGGRWRCGWSLYLPSQMAPRAVDEAVRELPSLRCGSCGHRYSGFELVQLGHQPLGMAS